MHDNTLSLFSPSKYTYTHRFVCCSCCVVVAKVVKFGERTESMPQKTVHRNWCTIAFIQTVLVSRHQVLQHMATLIMVFDKGQSRGAYVFSKFAKLSKKHLNSPKTLDSSAVSPRPPVFSRSTLKYPALLLRYFSQFKI